MSRARKRYGEIADLKRHFRSPLYVNSLFLMGGPVVSAGLGLAFWILAARFTSAESIGIATAVFASVNLLMALGDLGLGTSLIHYGSSNRVEPAPLVNTVVAYGWLCISVIAVIFLIGIPLWSPGLMAVRAETSLLFFFFAYAAFNHILGLQDAALLTQGRANYVFWRNVACNLPPILLVPLLTNVTSGHGSLIWSYGAPNIIVGLVMGTLVLPRYFSGYRFFGSLSTDLLGKIAGYGLPNHASNILWGTPAYVMPLIAINSLTAAETGQFYIIWTIANFVLIAPRMVTYSLFAEGSRNHKTLLSLSIHALILILIWVLPAILLLWFRGDSILRLFGRAYVNMSLLRFLLLSIVPFSINSIYFVILRVHGRLKQNIYFSGITALLTLVAATVLVQLRGVEGLALGWFMGHSLVAFLILYKVVRSYFVGIVTGTLEYS